MKKTRSNKSRDAIPFNIAENKSAQSKSIFLPEFSKSKKIARVREINQGSGPWYENSLDNRVWITIMSIFIPSNVKGFFVDELASHCIFCCI
jgi:hypothetical protein